MLSQDEIERERYKSRLRKQRDDASFASAWRNEGRAEGRAEGREAGVLIGRILTLQELLGRSDFTREQLEQKLEVELQAIADQLRSALGQSK